MTQQNDQIIADISRESLDQRDTISYDILSSK